jgi:hypothetical protein
MTKKRAKNHVGAPSPADLRADARSSAARLAEVSATWFVERAPPTDLDIETSGKIVAEYADGYLKYLRETGLADDLLVEWLAEFLVTHASDTARRYAEHFGADNAVN